MGEYEQGELRLSEEDNSKAEEITSLYPIKKEEGEKMDVKEKPSVISILPSRRIRIDDLGRIPSPEELFLLEKREGIAEQYIGEQKESHLEQLASQIEVYKILNEAGIQKDVAYLDKETGKYVSENPVEQTDEEDNKKIKEAPIVSISDAYHRWQVENDK